MPFCVQYDNTTGAICATVQTATPPKELPDGRGQLVFDEPVDFDPHTTRVNLKTLELEDVPEPAPDPVAVADRIAALQAQIDALKAGGA